MFDTKIEKLLCDGTISLGAWMELLTAKAKAVLPMPASERRSNPHQTVVVMIILFKSRRDIGPCDTASNYDNTAD